MGSLLLVAAIVLLIACVLPWLYVVLGMRGTDFLFFSCVALPAVWLGRFDLYFLPFQQRAFYLLWGVLLLGVVCLVALPHPRTRAQLAVGRRHVMAWLLAVLMVMLLSTLFNLQSKRDLVHGIHAACFVAIPPLAAWAVVRCCRIDDVTIPRIVSSFCCVGLFVGVLGVGTALMPGFFAGIVTTYKTAAGSGRAFTPIGGPSATGMCLLLVYCLAVGQALSGQKRTLALVVVSVCFLGLLTTLARAALVSFVVANVYLVLRYRAGLFRRMLMMATFAVVVFAPMAYGLSQTYTLERFSLAQNHRSASLEMRSASLQAALVYGAHRVLLGGGWGLVYPAPREGERVGEKPKTMYLDNHLTAPKPHNVFALVFAETGAIGLGVVLLFLFQLWRGLKPPDASVSPEGHALLHGFRGGFIGFMVFSAMQDHLFLTTKIALFFYVFIFAGLAVAGHYRIQRDRDELGAPYSEPA